MAENHVSDDIEKGAETAVKAARTVVDAGKAVGMAASGNYVGAAKQVLQSEGLRKVIAVLLISSFLLTLVVFFAAPLALYEGVKGYYETIRDRWYEEYYGANGSRAIAALKATLSGIVDIFGDLWNSLVGKITTNGPNKPDTDTMSSEDLAVFGPTESLISVYEKKLDACINKIEARQKMVEEAIVASANGSYQNTGTINGYVYNYRYLTDSAPYLQLEDTKWVQYGGVRVTSGTQPMTRREAVRVMALYSAMYNCNVDLIQPYALMKWLGYYTGSSQPMYFFVGNNEVVCSIKGWQGEFMPQYLIEEEMKNPDMDYSRFKCPAADVLLVVHSDPLISLVPNVEKLEIQETETVYGTTQGWQYRLMTDYTYNNWSSYYSTHGYSYSPNLSYYPGDGMSADEAYNYYRGSLSYDLFKTYWERNLLNLQWRLVYDYYTGYYDVPVTKYGYTLTYNLNASVSLRPVETISKLAGFYEKDHDSTASNEEAQPAA